MFYITNYETLVETYKMKTLFLIPFQAMQTYILYIYKHRNHLQHFNSVPQLQVNMT